MIKYLFPFGQVNKGDKIIIYGYGNVGRSYIEQILSTGYCEIVAIADKMASNIVSDKIRLIKPNDIVKEKFDKIIIALQNENISVEVRKFLVNIGVDKEQIISSCKRIETDNITLPYVIKSAYDDDILHVGVEGRGGLGDVVLTLPFLMKIKDLLGDKLEISFLTKYDEILNYTSKRMFC